MNVPTSALVAAGAIGVVGVAAAAHGGGASQPQTRTVHEVRILEPTVIYHAPKPKPKPLFSHQHQRSWDKFVNSNDPQQAGATPQSIAQQAAAAQTTSTPTSTPAPASPTSTPPPASPTSTPPPSSPPPSSSSTPASRHASAMKGVATKCARRELVLPATCARDGFPYG